MPKPMKVMKAELKKKPAASGLAGLKDKNKEGMSLEDKMELFRKRGTDIGSFLDSLTKHQREALWQRFSAARSALKDGEAEALWASVAKGKGSDPAKRKLLACFLKMGGDLKGKRDLWHKELLCYTKSSGNFPANKLFAAGPVKGFALPACYLPEVRGEWAPFQTVLKRFGLQECLRRASCLCIYLCGSCPSNSYLPIATDLGEKGKHRLQKGSPGRGVAVCLEEVCGMD